MRHDLTTVRWMAVLLALAMLAAACGSTVAPGQGTSRVVAFDGGEGEAELELAEGDWELEGEDELTLGDELGVEVAPEGGDAAAGSGAAGESAAAPAPVADSQGTTEGGAPAGAAAGGDGGTASQPAAGAASSGVRPTAAGAKGVDDRRIHLGMAYSDDTGQANEALGISGITQGDPRRNYEALMAWVNARGGLAGREVVPVWHQYRSASGEGWNAQDQAACSTFTQDNEVFVSLSAGIGPDGTFLGCMENAGIAILDNVPSNGRADSDDTFSRFPRYSSLLWLSNDKIAQIWPGGLKAGGYFEPSGALAEVKVGVVTYDSDPFRKPVERSLRPAMRAAGHEIAQEVYIRPPANNADVGQMSAELASAVLRFRQEGIGHVMIFDASSALITFLFMTAAENQGYRPRYGMNSANGGQLIADQAPAGQMKDAISVGWNPNFDVPAGDFTAWTPARALCDGIFKEAGITFDNTNAQTVGYLQCDQIRGLVAAVDASEGPLTNDSVVQGVQRLGSSLDSATMGPTRFAPDRRYGIARYRLAEFDDACSCFAYTSDWRGVP
jgi:hypothetical protein